MNNTGIRQYRLDELMNVENEIKNDWVNRCLIVNICNTYAKEYMSVKQLDTVVSVVCYYYYYYGIHSHYIDSAE